jgi:hypothetical protein
MVICSLVRSKVWRLRGIGNLGDMAEFSRCGRTAIREGSTLRTGPKVVSIDEEDQEFTKFKF